MIRIVRASDPVSAGAEVGAEALLLSVGTDLEALTSAERSLARQAGADTLGRLHSLGDLPMGGAVVTPGGELPFPFLIHVVIRSPEEAVSEAGIRRAFLNGLRQASEWGVETLAVPPLGIGAGNLDAEDAARVMVEALQVHRMSSFLPRTLVVLVGGRYEEEVFLQVSRRLVPPDPDQGVGGGKGD